MITPKELAARLGDDPKRVRRVLRKLYRPNGEDKNARWLLDEAMVAETTAQLRSMGRQ